MTNKKVAITSKMAYDSITQDQLQPMYKKIIAALTELGPSTYEELSIHLKEKPDRIWKRLSEVGKMDLIHRTGDIRKLSSGRFGMIWAVGATPETVKMSKKSLPGKTIADYSRALIQPNPSSNIRSKLF